MNARVLNMCACGAHDRLIRCDDGEMRCFACRVRDNFDPRNGRDLRDQNKEKQHMQRESGVRSAPMTDGRVADTDRERMAQQAPPRTVARGGIRWDRLPLVLLGWVIFGIWWLAGGRYTIDGLPYLANEIFSFFRAPVSLGPVTDWRWYVVLCWLPVVISLAERRYAPWRRLVWSVIMVWVIFVWVIVSSLDAGSTYLAVTHPPLDARELSKQVAGLPLLAAIWSILTTFAPETGMAVLWRWLWRG